MEIIADAVRNTGVGSPITEQMIDQIINSAASLKDVDYRALKQIDSFLRRELIQNRSGDTSGLIDTLDNQALKAKEKDLQNFKLQLESQDKQLNEFRNRLKHEQIAQEKRLQGEIESREKLLDKREKHFKEQRSRTELQLQELMQEADALKTKLHNDITQKEAEFALKEGALLRTSLDLEAEKERYKEESLKKVEQHSKAYVDDALDSLSRKAAQFQDTAKNWSLLGAGSLIAGAVFFGWVTTTSFSSIPNPVTWEFIALSVFKGLISVALFAGLAKSAFALSNSHMRESLKNSDRKHAINFGKFYLGLHGPTTDWAQIKEAFEHWNIGGEPNYKQDEDQLDIGSLEKMATFLERVSNTMPSIAKNKD